MIDIFIYRLLEIKIKNLLINDYLACDIYGGIFVLPLINSIVWNYPLFDTAKKIVNGFISGSIF